jgi:hypothetical protein
MLQARGYPQLSDRDERALDAIHSAFERWTQTRKARKLAQRFYQEIHYELGHVERSAGKHLDLDFDDLGERLVDAITADVHQNVAHHAGQAVHQAVQQSVHSAVHAAVHSAVQDAASHATGSHADGGGGHH